jgi:hypothetical protein
LPLPRFCLLLYQLYILTHRKKGRREKENEGEREAEAEGERGTKGENGTRTVANFGRKEGQISNPRL